MNTKQISETRIIDAPASEIFALLADPSQHPRIDGTGSVRAVQPGGPQRLTLGATFGMDMQIGAPYKIVNTVVEFEPDRLIAWRHFNGHRWRWRLQPLADGHTRVTETFDWSTARIPLLITLSPFPHRNRRGIHKSLERLAEITAPASR
jgi:uncharacterized protein YndB with AHSA1/START domain